MLGAGLSSALLHGSVGLLWGYATVQAPLWAGLWRGGAPLRSFVTAPLLAAPLTLASGLGAAAAATWLQSFGAGTVLQLAAGVGLSTVVGYGAGRALAARAVAQPLSAHRRGALVADAPRPGPGSRGAGVALDRTRAGVTLAGLPVPHADETKHFKLIGTTGTGKSTAISEMLAAALARGDRAVIADPDGGYLRRFYDERRGDVILNPFDARSAKWDLFGEISNDYDVEQLARSLIPDHEGQDRSWRAYARTFFTAVTSQAHAAGSRDVSELYRLLVVAGTAELKTLVAGTPAQPFLEEHNGRMFDSIRSVTSSAVSALDYVARQRARPLAVRDWAQHPDVHGGVLYLPYRAGQIAALRSTISAWMRLAIFETMGREPDGQRLWFIVDELDALGQIDGLKDALARLRKFDGRCVLGFQSIAQVSSTYGSGEAQTLVENCGNTLILRCSGSEHGGTSQFASRLIGEREVTRISTSRSRTAFELRSHVTYAEHVGVESAVMGSQIEQLPDLAGYLKLASSPQWLRVALRPAPYTPQTARTRSATVLEFAPRRAPEREGAARADAREGPEYE